MTRFIFGLVLVAGCVGSGGADAAWTPQAPGAEPTKLVSSAVELKTEGDKNKLVEQGAVLLGRVSISDKGVRDDVSQSHGGSELSGHAAIEAAKHGGTHFYLEASDHKRATTYWQADSATARFGIYRVEKDQWSKLDAQYQPH